MKAIYTLWCWLMALCLAYSSYQGYAQVCQSSFGMEDGSIKESQLSVSSVWSGLSAAKHGRLNGKAGYGAWCPLQNLRWYRDQYGGPYYDQYFEVRFLKPVRITAVGTQGRSENFGNEGVEDFYVNYTLLAFGNVLWKQFHEWMHPLPKKFPGNKYMMNVTKMNYFRPPFVADTFRLVPEIYPINQICLRMELYGCDMQHDLVSYTMNTGNIRSPGYNLTDKIFDGVVTPTMLYSGLGFLTDGHLAHDNFIENKGYGWIGWHSRQTRSPSIIFHFLKPRIFRSVTFHCNIRTRSGIELFKHVKISFSADNVTFHSSVMHKTVKVSSGYKWINYNVTVDLCNHYGHVIKMQFAYGGEWMLISEVTFESDPFSGMRLPKPECKPVTSPPVVVLPTDELRTTTPQLNITVFGPQPESSSGLDDGAIIGIVCGILFILLVLLVFLCCWCYRKRTLHTDKPFINNFLRWELKPYSSYRNPIRISRLDSTGEEVKNFTFKRQDQNGEASHYVVPVDAESAIYASIENLEEAVKPEEQMFKKGSKPRKPRNKPPPLPAGSLHCADDEHYDLPDTPLMPSHPTDEDGYCSPEPKSPLLSPLVSPPPQKPNQSDVFYAEPEAPSKQTGGYSEPIDAVLPSEGIFRNPIYEEIYSEPYQGVSGTSLYANPSTTLRTRQDTCKEFPREQLFFKEKIGDGQFGEVHLGEAEGLSEFLGEDMNANKRVLVAIKKLKAEVDKNIKEDFFKEVKVMSGVQHENVIRLLGVCSDDPMCMIVEYMVNGDLNQFLKERELPPGTKGNKEKVLTYQALIYMASQIAAGMKYISSLKFVHRDLATRNCLVGHSYTVKIADFGMSRHLYSKHYYRVHGRVILPIRWMAPECILQGKFTPESDVWAFAVTLWEILTLAAEYPYNDLTDEQVIENIQRMFFRPTCTQIVYLGQPSICPDDVYDMMKSCWQKDPNARPNFMDIFVFMKSKVRLSEMAI